MTGDFKGFKKPFFDFFAELAENNERPWFEANKARYQEDVVAPMVAFIEDMAPRLAKISPHFIANPKPNGGSMFRIYRDVRFSKDKRPYKEHAACQFRHAAGKDAHAPGFYVHLEPGNVRFGGGIWTPPADKLADMRKAIARHPDDWRKITAARKFRDVFGEVLGDSLVRPPKGFDADHPLIGDIKRKSFFAMNRASQSAAGKPAFADEVEKTFKSMKPFMAFIGEAVGVEV